MRSSGSMWGRMFGALPLSLAAGYVMLRLAHIMGWL